MGLGLQLIPATRAVLEEQAPHFVLPDLEPGSPVQFPEPPADRLVPRLCPLESD